MRNLLDLKSEQASLGQSFLAFGSHEIVEDRRPIAVVLGEHISHLTDFPKAKTPKVHTLLRAVPAMK